MLEDEPLEGILADRLSSRANSAENEALNLRVDAHRVAMANQSLKECLGLALVYILQHTDKYNEHIALIRRIETMISPK